MKLKNIWRWACVIVFAIPWFFLTWVYIASKYLRNKLADLITFLTK